MRVRAARAHEAAGLGSAGHSTAKALLTNALAASRTLIVVRWVLVAWAVVDVGSVVLLPPRSEEPIREAFILVFSWITVLVSTYRVTWAALAGAVLIVVASLVGSVLPAINVFIFVPVAVCAFSTWPVLLSTAMGYLVIGIAGQFYDGQHGRLVVTIVALVLGSSFVGFVIRLLLARSRWAGRQIRDLEDAAAQLRESERLALAGELTGLLSTGLADQRQRLKDARTVADSEALRELLEGTARGARMALSQLRGLVQTLRGRVEGPVAVTASASLMETVEEVDELLTGHGFWVELDTSAAFRSRPPSAAGRLLGELVRAAGACILARAEPGDQCALIISHDDGEVHLRFVSPCVTDSHDLLEVRRRIETMGGSVRMLGEGGVQASMPLNPVDDSGVQPGCSQAWDMEAATRVALTLALLLAALVMVVPSSPLTFQISGILWGVLLVGLALCMWRPPWGCVLITAVFIVSLWTFAPTVVIGVANLPFVILMAMVTAYWPRRVWALLLVGAASFVIWFGEVNADVVFLLTVYGGIGILAGMAARYFLLMRRGQRTQLNDATAEHEDAQTRVRRELAGELHDIVAHQLTLISLHVDAHRDVTDPDILHAALERTDSILASTQSDLAFLLHVMRTSAAGAPEEGLVGPVVAVDTAALTLRTSGRDVEVTFDSAVDVVDPTTSRTLTRVVREASTNILRYAPAHARCAISIVQDVEQIRVTVRSELAEGGGESGDEFGQSDDSTGLGLVGLSERLRLTGGSLSAGKEAGEWVVKAQLPVLFA